MWTGYRKTIFTTIIVVLVAFSFHFFKNENQLHGVLLKFEEYVDELWKRDLYDTIKARSYYTGWSVKPFDERIAHCSAYCSDKKNNETLYFDPKCETYPALIYDAEFTTDILQKVSIAEATLPCILELDLSHIPGAGYGIFTKYIIPEGFIFGPYKGVARDTSQPKENDVARNYAYTWGVMYTNENGKIDVFELDAEDKNQSNWLRWVNSARYEEEQNLVSIMFNMSVYYVTYKNIEPYTELLVWYGKAYANHLSISVKPNSLYDWYTYYAPPLSDVICPSCPYSSETEDED